MKYKLLSNQLKAFKCGTAPVILFSMDKDLKKRDHGQIQVVKTLATLLYNSQRPQPVFDEGPASILIDETGIDLLVCKVVNDDLERHTNIIPLKTYRFLDSKCGLGWKYNRLESTERFATHILTPTTKYRSSTNRMSRYISPAGANVEGADGFHVADLNVRITGSCCLPLLRTHFKTWWLYVAPYGVLLY